MPVPQANDERGRDRPEQATVIRWGVVGPGAIATGFADAMRSVEDGEIVAVASRAIERADGFGDRWGIPNRYDDVEALATDPEVDVVYVATPHSRHESDTLSCLTAGKHVLCEKPLAINAVQARRMVESARSRGLFLMEAIWSRFLPAYRSLVDVLTARRIGEPVLVEADFGMRVPIDPAGRLFDLAQGGGALLDLGIYPVQLCSLVLGNPEHVVGDGIVGATGVDEQVAAILRYPSGGLGVVKAAIRATMACTARISGSDGWIEIPAFMHCPTSFTVRTLAGEDRIDGSFDGNGLRFEIAEVHRCLAERQMESASITLNESIAIASTLDTIRAQLGVVYPGE